MASPSKAKAISKSDQTSIKAVHVHLHVRYQCDSGYISCAISSLAELMVTNEADGDDHNVFVRCAAVSHTARRRFEGQVLIACRDSNGVRVNHRRRTCRYC